MAIVTAPIDPSAISTRDRERFASHTRREGACLVWTGAQSGTGYGKFGLNGRNARAHRVAYVMATGEDIAPGLTIDHLCGNTLCVEPDHLRAVTNAENILRSSAPSARMMRSLRDFGTCPQGHDMSEPDAWYRWRYGRQCRKCRAQERSRRYRMLGR